MTSTFRRRDQWFAGTTEEKSPGLQGVRVVVILHFELAQLGDLLQGGVQKGYVCVCVRFKALKGNNYGN